MIKVDIINEVSKAADITKVKAEVAVEAVLEAMKDSMMRGERIELRGFGVFQVKPRKRGIGRNPRTGKEVQDPARPDHPLQARQGPPEPEPVAAPPRPVSVPRARPIPRSRSTTSRSPRPGSGVVASAARAPLALAGLRAGTRLLLRRSPRSPIYADRAGPCSPLGLLEHPARPRDGPLPGLPATTASTPPCPSSFPLPSSAWWARWAPSSGSAARIPHRRALFDIGIAGPLAGFAVCLPVLWLGRARRPAVVPTAPDRMRRSSSGEPLLFQWRGPLAARDRSRTG